MNKEGRLHLRLEATLVDDIKGYARKRGLTLTSLVQQYFRYLLEEEKQKTFEAEQI